jgi:hypothetical protein
MGKVQSHGWVFALVFRIEKITGHKGDIVLNGFFEQ